jgi:hypothetical protein
VKFAGIWDTANRILQALSAEGSPLQAARIAKLSVGVRVLQPIPQSPQAALGLNECGFPNSILLLPDREFSHLPVADCWDANSAL